MARRNAPGSNFVAAVVLFLAGLVPPAAGAAETQEDGDGRAFLCAPELKIEPTITFEPLFRRPVIEKLEDGRVVSRTKPGRESVFELVVSLGIPTTIPRVSFTVETIFKPFADFENEPEAELELNLELFGPEQTGGWVESHFDIVDKFSPSERPGDEGAYTHKLNLEWDTAFRPFRQLPDDRYLAHVELEGSLDYVATGLPEAGDVVGDGRFATDANPWSFSLLFVFPVAPLPP